MKKIIIGSVAGLLLTSVAVAQPAPAPKEHNEKPAIMTPKEVNPLAPVAGKNSFTENQVKTRLKEAGYHDITGLKLDEKGVWNAHATKNANPVTVHLDYQGNIVEK